MKSRHRGDLAAVFRDICSRFPHDLMDPYQKLGGQSTILNTPRQVIVCDMEGYVTHEGVQKVPPVWG